MEAIGVILFLVICGPGICMVIASIGMCGRQASHAKEKKRLMRLMEEHPEHAGEILQTIREKETRYQNEFRGYQQAMGHLADSYDKAGKKYSEAGGTMRCVGGKMAGGVLKGVIKAAAKKR